MNAIFAQRTVLVTLSYDNDGKPLVIASGKRREREHDLGLINDWLAAIAREIRGDEVSA